jgi:hypothetical protein
MEISREWMGLELLVGSLSYAPVAVEVFYSPDSGKTYQQVKTVDMPPDTAVQDIMLNFNELPNADKAILKVTARSDGATCLDSTAWFINKLGITSILNIPVEPSGISIYPNPAKDHFVIAFSGKAPSHGTMKIYNQLGLLSKTFFIEKRVVERGMEVSGLAPGIYCLVFEFKKQDVKTKRVIIQE